MKYLFSLIFIIFILFTLIVPPAFSQTTYDLKVVGTWYNAACTVFSGDYSPTFTVSHDNYQLVVTGSNDGCPGQYYFNVIDLTTNHVLYTSTLAHRMLLCT